VQLELLRSLHPPYTACETGTAVFLVEQLIEKTLALADRVYALARGSIVLEAATGEAVGAAPSATTDRVAAPSPVRGRRASQAFQQALAGEGLRAQPRLSQGRFCHTVAFLVTLKAGSCRTSASRSIPP
jgi:ABC-type glutathione transport system ATPase component